MEHIYRSPSKFWRFLSYLFTAIIIFSLLSPLTATNALASDVPQPIYPDVDAITTTETDPPLGIPSFRWSPVAGANIYRIQVANDIAFASKVIDNTTRNTSFTPSLVQHLLADGEWYWHVRVEDPIPASAWSETRMFIKKWVLGIGVQPNQPIPISPAEGAQLAFFDAPTFSWTPVMGASKYRLQIATDSDFASLIPNTILDTLSTSYQPSLKLANGQYWWRVYPVDAFNHLGAVSEVRSFTLAFGMPALDMVPTQIEPKDESYPVFTPTFRWTAVEGAQLYRLEYTSDETCDFGASAGTGVDTRQTSYTPTVTFPNDKRYCWRVRVESEKAVGAWSDTWHFLKRWYLQPQLLTPTKLYPTGLYPMFSWTPVPGAAYYQIEVATSASIESSTIEKYYTANTTYAPQKLYLGDQWYYWRVTPYDGSGNKGLTSAVWEFLSDHRFTAPIQVYPLYYYPPNDPVYYGTNTMNPVVDRSVAYPIFIWHRVITASPVGGVFATAYRLQVAIDVPDFEYNRVWQYDTENTSASPTHGNGFIPVVGHDYYWRVCVLIQLGGDCVTGPYTGWSQVWRARFDPALALPATTGAGPTLLRPAEGQESVEATPLLEWWPLQGASQYKVEIDRNSDFSTVEITNTAIVDIPAYAPWYSLAERRLDRTDYGTFYWRVCTRVGETWSNCSAPGRFQVASQSEWRYDRTLGSVDNQLLIGTDPISDVITTTYDIITTTYDLSTLYASQSDGFWFLGFNADLTTTDTTYVFYLDLDHVDGSGASTPPTVNPNIVDVDVSTAPPFMPEYAIYVKKVGGVINADNTWVFAWDGAQWNYGDKLSGILGEIYAYDDYVELKLPNAAIGMSQVTGSMSVMLFSVDEQGLVKDSVPSDPQVTGEPGITPVLSRFSAVSERMNLIYPPNMVSPNIPGDPSTISSLLPFYWDWPTGSDPSTPFAGAILEVHKDESYTTFVSEFKIVSTKPYFCPHDVTFLDDLVGDNIYYWRVQPRYKLEYQEEKFGVWTGGWSFRRLGFTPQNLQTSVTWATPTFSWDRVEGASTYRLQVSINESFDAPVINITTPMNSYTPILTLPQGLYYWRVQVIRYQTPADDWSSVEQLNLNLPSPIGLTPTLDQPVSYAPTFCWQPLTRYSITEPDVPVLTAWKYRVQVSRDETFSTPVWDWIDTFNNCWTPIKGYLDGKYYWHVAMIDGNNRLGPYSNPVATFVKQYPITTLKSPLAGAVTKTPTFIWTPVDGAAYYRIEISKYKTFSPLYDSVTTINTQFTPTKNYDKDVAYYWRVAMIDRDNRQGPFTGSTIVIEVGKKIYLPQIIR